MLYHLLFIIVKSIANMQIVLMHLQLLISYFNYNMAKQFFILISFKEIRKFHQMLLQ